MMSNKEVVDELKKIKDQVSKLGHKYIAGQKLPLPIDVLIKELAPFVNIERAIQTEIKLTFNNGRSKVKTHKLKQA